MTTPARPLRLVHAAYVVVREREPQALPRVLVRVALVLARERLVAERAVELVEELGDHADGDEAVLVAELRLDGRRRVRGGTVLREPGDAFRRRVRRGRDADAAAEYGAEEGDVPEGHSIQSDVGVEFIGVS